MMHLLSARAFAGFTSSYKSCEEWVVVTVLRFALRPSLMATAFFVSGCQLGTHPPQTAALAATSVDLRQQEIEERKDEMVRQLAHCESGGSGPSDRPIYGGRGAFVGRLQFSVQTASLATYLIFELEEPHHWPLCSRKIALRNEMAHIKELTSQAALAR